MSSKSKEHKKTHSEDCFPVMVRLLEEEVWEEVRVPTNATGKWLFEVVCRHQGVSEEREYFGLRYLEHELLSAPTKQWLNLSRTVHTQLKHTSPRVVSFRIKHYPAEPLTDLSLPKTHYLLYRQLRRDLSSGRLVAPSNELIRLASLVVQVELGDSSEQDLPVLNDKKELVSTYVCTLRVLHHQTKRVEAAIAEEHSKLEGMLPSDAASEMIQLASSLPTYGIDPIRVKTKTYGSRPIHLGLTHRGVAEFVSNQCQHLHLWSNISFLTCDGKHFVISVAKRTSGKSKKTTLDTVSYKCETKAVARSLWEWASDRKLFLTLEKSSSAKPVKSKSGFFSRSHTFRFSGRCRKEILSRPSLAATLPANLSDLAPTTNALHSVSMVGLVTSDSPEQITERLQVTSAGPTNAPTEPGLECFTQTLSGSIGQSQISTLQSVLSEPVNAPSDSPSTRARSTLPLGSDFSNKQLPTSTGAGVRVVRSDQLAPFFKNLTKRRYSPNAKVRQKRLLRLQRRNVSVEERNQEVFDSDDDDTDAEQIAVESALEALNAATEMGQNLIGNPSSQVSPNKSSLSKSDSTQSIDSSSNERSGISAIVPRSRAAWRLVAISAGFLASASIIGMVFMFEMDVYRPLNNVFRGQTWFSDLDARLYRPFRSTIFGFWRP